MGLVRRYAKSETALAIGKIAEDAFDLDVNDRTRRAKQRRLTANQIDQLCADYRSGMRVADIAVKFGVHRYTVTIHAKRQGIKLREKRKLNDFQASKAAKEYEGGATLTELAETYDVDVITIRKELAQAGGKIRDSKFKSGQ